MKFQGKTPLQEACGFVVVNSALHDQFDLFKEDLDRDYSVFEYVRLLQFWIETQSPSLVSAVTIQKFGKQYIILHRDEMDRFVVWLNDTRDQFQQVGQV